MLTDLETDTISFAKIAWRVEGIKARRRNFKKQTVEYLLIWKSFNGHIFNK
jgi:hypothetical protein